MRPRVEYDGEEVEEVVTVFNFSYLGRFFFDTIFLFVLVVLVINMVAGIIIDTFSFLK